MDEDLKKVLVGLTAEVMTLRRDLALMAGKSRFEAISDARLTMENLQQNLQGYGLRDPTLQAALEEMAQAFR